MDAKKTDALVEVIRAILGPSDRNLSKERILALLAAAGNDPDKAVDLYFQAEAANGAEFKQNDVEGDVDDDGDWPPQAAELSDLLGGDVKKPVILDLLRRTKSNLQKAVEIYFAEHGADGDEDEDDEDESDEDDASAAAAATTPAPSHNALFPAPAPRSSVTAAPAASSAELPPTPSAATPIAAQPLEPLHQPAVASPPLAPVTPEQPDASPAAPAKAPAPADSESLKGPGTYEVTITDSKVKWQIGAVFGRAVVQYVTPAGPAALAGIHKSDVLLAFRGSVLSDKNCAAVVQELSAEEIPVPSTLVFRRAPESGAHQHPVAVAAKSGDVTEHQNGVAAPAAVAASTPTPAAPASPTIEAKPAAAAAVAPTSLPSQPPAPIAVPVEKSTKEEVDIDDLPDQLKEDIDIDIDDDLPEPPKKDPVVAVSEQPKDDIDIDDLPEHHEEAKPDVQLPTVPEGIEPAIAAVVAASTVPDEDVVMEEPVEDYALLEKVEPKYGLQTLCRAVEAMVDAIGDTSVEFKVIMDLLLLAEFNLDRAVNNFLNEDRLASDFRRVIGYNWTPANPSACWGGSVYMATIPAGPLGLTVENILERTIVVDIKAGGSAERAGVKRTSWLVALNGVEITRLTHKETLRMIETASRPLLLQLIVVPQDEYKDLRKQLSMNIRQQKTERPVPEQDRMSFRVFQLKIHQAVLVFPKAVAVALFQYLSTEEYHPPTLDSSYPNPLNQFIASSEDWERILLQETRQMQEERSGEMCTERRFLLNLFSQIHEYDDKGESTVIRTIQFLGWLAKRAAEMKQFASSKAAKGPKAGAIGLFEQRYTLLLSVILHVLESLSIIENHATWDVMVSAFKMVILALTPSDVGTFLIPMMARHSISSSPTARIVPISLVAMVYPHVSEDVPVQLRGMFERMCSDDNPLVRRAVTSVIADLAIAAGWSAAAWTVGLLERATADSHDIVRIFAVKSCIQLATNLRGILNSNPNATSEEAEQSLRLLYIQMVPMVNTYASDSSWQVRLETARTLPAFCRAFGAEYTDIFVDHFVAMVRDPTVEVRKACADGGYLLSDVLVELALRRETSAATGEDEWGKLKWLSLKDSTDEHVIAAQAKIMRSVLPATYRLATDVSVAVRQSLAKTVGKSLQLVGGAYYNDLVPIFAELLDDNQDANVRAALLEEVVRYFDSSSETIGSMVFPVLHSLLVSPQWRVRVKFVQCVASWGARTDGAVVPLEFADGCLQLLSDPVHDVRAMVCSTLPVLVKSLGREWLAEKGVPRIAACLQATFHGRVTGLAAVELLASELLEIEKLREVVESVAEECKSKTANLRFRALRTLSVLVPVLNDPSTTENTLEIVWDLVRAEKEADPDVREAAEATRVVLEALRCGGLVTPPLASFRLAGAATTTDAVSPDPAGAAASPALVAYVRASAASSSDSRGVSCNDVDAGAREKLALASRERARLFLRLYGLLAGYSLLAALLLVLMTYLSFFAATMDDGGATPEFVGCRSWAYGDGCGLWGIDCRPFESEWSAFRCPTKCNLDGDTSLVVYGSGPYRADSRICRAAIHAGVIGSNGGCGFYKYSGAANSFHASTSNGVSTQEFLSWFPKTIEFQAGPSSYCTDLSWGVMSVGVVALFGYALLPRTNPAMLFYLLVGWGFMYVRIVGQPSSVDYKGIAINSFAEVFVLLGASHFVYHVGPVHTFREWRQLPARRRVVLWGLCYVLPFNILLHMNYFAYLPWLNIDLGGYQETESNAGSYIVLAIGALFALYCAWVFLRQLWRLGVWHKFLAVYAAIAVWVVLTWALFNSTYFHLHHTMLGALLIPFTRFPTPLAAFAQSAALGAFVQGYAAWGWSAYLTIMTTFYAMDRPKVPPTVLNVTTNAANVSWTPLRDVDGYSLRMNKVEVYRGLDTTAVISHLQPNMTYFITVAGVASWGTNGRDGPTANFTTPAS